MRSSQITVGELRKILAPLPDDAVVLASGTNVINGVKDVASVELLATDGQVIEVYLKLEE